MFYFWYFGILIYENLLNSYIFLQTNPISGWLLRQSVALRTRIFHKPYGDQGIFVTKRAFQQTGGYPEWPLLEDLAMVQQLRRNYGSPRIIHRPLETSGRRWKALGLIQTTLINQAILIGYSLGIDPYKLADLYHGSSREEEAQIRN